MVRIKNPDDATEKATRIPETTRNVGTSPNKATISEKHNWCNIAHIKQNGETQSITYSNGQETQH